MSRTAGTRAGIAHVGRLRTLAGVAAGAILVAIGIGLLVSSAPRAQDPGGGDSRAESREPGADGAVDRHESRAGNRADAPYPDAVRSLSDTLEVRFGDGRPDLLLPVLKRMDGAFLRVGDLGRICGRGFVWDPETYLGRVDVDTTSVSFLLDSPFFWGDTEIVQLAERTIYDGNQLWLPLSLLAKVIAPIYGERMVWDRRQGQIFVAAPRPWLRDLTFDRSGRTLDLAIRPLPEGDYRLRWDPVGELVLEIRGLHLPPGQTQPTFRDRDVRGVRLESRPGGMAVRISVEPGWVGARIQEREGDLVVGMTQLLQDVQRGEADLLSSFHPPKLGSRTWGARVVLEVSPPGPGGSAESRYLEDLASEVANQLEDVFRHQVVFVPDRRNEGRKPGPSGTPELPAVPDADLWVGLRLERYGSAEAPDFLLVVPGQAPRYETVGAQVASAGIPIASTGGDQVLAPPLPGGQTHEAAYRMIPWGQAPRIEQDQSRRLADLLSDRLQADLQFRPVRTMARSARIFRGLSMPAVLVYPATAADAAGVRALSAPDQIELVGKSLAEGIDQFLREQEAGR